MLTFTFVEPSSSIIIGDKKGMIHQIYITDQVVALTNQFQVHNDEIYFILSPNALADIILHTNGNNISVYDSQDGKELNDSCNYGEEQEFLAILLSNDSSKLFMNLYSQTQINIYIMNCAREINLTQIIQLYTNYYNISLCFNDRILLLLNDVGFEFRHLQDDKIPLIKEISVVGTESYFFNRQHPNLNKLLSLKDTEIIVNEKIY